MKKIILTVGIIIAGITAIKIYARNESIKECKKIDDELEKILNSSNVSYGSKVKLFIHHPELRDKISLTDTLKEEIK